LALPPPQKSRHSASEIQRVHWLAYSMLKRD
jgi:hypothetical protein